MPLECRSVSGFLRGILECLENSPSFQVSADDITLTTLTTQVQDQFQGPKEIPVTTLNRSRATCDQCDAMCPFVLVPDPKRYILKCDLMTVDS